MKFSKKIIMSSVLVVFFANCLLVNLSSGNPMPPLEDSHNLMEFDFPLNGTVELVVFDYFHLGRFRWGDYERLVVHSEFHHDSNIVELEPNYINCTYRNVTFSGNNFGIDVEKIDPYLLREVFWWQVFNGTNIITRTTYRKVVFDENYDPIINITNLNVTTEKLPVSFDVYARDDPNDLRGSPEKVGSWKLWSKAVVITFGVITGIILWLIWVNCISIEDKPKSKESESEEQPLTELENDNEALKAIRDGIRYRQSRLDSDHETNFCPECGHPLQKGEKPRDQ